MSYRTPFPGPTASEGAGCMFLLLGMAALFAAVCWGMRILFGG